jgi:hypothetical protein
MAATTKTNSEEHLEDNSLLRKQFKYQRFENQRKKILTSITRYMLKKWFVSLMCIKAGRVQCMTISNKALFMLYVTGKAIQIPKIREPTQEDIDKYHKIYVEEVVRLFDAYKSRAGPMYDNKQ